MGQERRPPRRICAGAVFGCSGIDPEQEPQSLNNDYASVRTLVTFGSTEMPGPNVVATVAFWM
ncbi:hypothetical protein QFZ35_001946 [Arthrobacter ulcerisalmonis]|nr:hypothetical protein [Arthrobacter ulcerisalmonis]